MVAAREAQGGGMWGVRELPLRVRDEWGELDSDYFDAVSRRGAGNAEGFVMSFALRDLCASA